MFSWFFLHADCLISSVRRTTRLGNVQVTAHAIVLAGVD